MLKGGIKIHRHLFKLLISKKFTKTCIFFNLEKGQTIGTITFIRAILAIMGSVTMLGCRNAVSIITSEVAGTTS